MKSGVIQTEYKKNQKNSNLSHSCKESNCVHELDSPFDTEDVIFTRQQFRARTSMEQADRLFCEEVSRHKDYAFDPDTGLWINKK